MAFYSPYGRGRIHHLAENESRLWVAHFYQIKGDKRNVFWNDNSIQLDRACGPCPWRGPMYSKPQKIPGFADRLDCSGRGRVTHLVWGNEPRRPNPSLPLPSLLGSSRPMENPRSDPLWTMWQVILVERMPTGVKGWVCLGGRVVPTWSDNCTTYSCSQAVLNQQGNQNM